MRRELSCSRAGNHSAASSLSFGQQLKGPTLLELFLQAVVRMGDILALALLVGALSLIVLMVRECLQPDTTGEDFATNLFNKIEEFRNDFQ